MDELRKGVFDFACKKFSTEVLENENSPNFLSLSTKWYLNLMRKELYLYRLLYFSDGFNMGRLSDLISTYTSNHAILTKMQSLYGLNQDVCRQILLRGFSFLHGIGALVSFNSFDISNDEIADMVKQTVAEMVRCAKADQAKEVEHGEI